MGEQLRAVPCTRDEANAYVRHLHRHAGVLPVHRFACAAVTADGVVRGVVIAGNPKARALDGGWELEVNRVCTEGYRNACSFLYARAIRFAKTGGFTVVYTYTTEEEDGGSLRAVGFRPEADTDARDWERERGPGRTAAGGPRVRWSLKVAEPLSVPVQWPHAVVEARPASLFEEPCRAA
jgi:hypothetical protein